MNREIKYRAWDTDNKEYIDCSQHRLSQLNNNYAGLGNRYIYEECIGQFDAMGTEIYEGDIIAAPDQTIPHTIVRHKYGWALQFIDEKTILPIVNDLCSLMTVLGNIRQHPELLKR